MVLSSPCGHAVLGSGSRCDAPGEPAAIGTTGRAPRWPGRDSTSPTEDVSSMSDRTDPLPEQPPESRPPDREQPTERLTPSEPAPGGYAPQEGWRPPAASGPPPGGPPPAGGYQPPGAGGPPPGETGAWRRLTRRMDRRVFAGVASGLGDYFNVDPVVFRVAFVVLSFTGGVGLLLYVALWIMVPPAGAGESIGQAALRRPNARTWIGIGLVLIAVLVLGGELGV